MREPGGSLPPNASTVGSIDVFNKMSARVMMTISYIRSGLDVDGAASLVANKKNKPPKYASSSSWSPAWVLLF